MGMLWITDLMGHYDVYQSWSTLLIIHAAWVRANCVQKCWANFSFHIVSTYPPTTPGETKNPTQVAHANFKAYSILLWEMTLYKCEFLYHRDKSLIWTLQLDL